MADDDIARGSRRAGRMRVTPTGADRMRRDGITTEDEARRNVVEAIAALYGPPAAEVDLRPPPPLRVKRVDVRLHE